MKSNQMKSNEIDMDMKYPCKPDVNTSFTIFTRIYKRNAFRGVPANYAEAVWRMCRKCVSFHREILATSYFRPGRGGVSPCSNTPTEVTRHVPA